MISASSPYQVRSYSCSVSGVDFGDRFTVALYKLFRKKTIRHYANIPIGKMAYQEMRHLTLLGCPEAVYTCGMSQNTSHLSIPGDCEIVSTYLTRALGVAGYQVIRSFDLQRARAVHTICACPHHGDAECSCQMIVLLVYLPNGEPRTLIAHGRDGVTHLGWDEALPESEEVALFTIIKDVCAQVKRTQEGKIPVSS